jgi:hypothetical protein
MKEETKLKLIDVLSELLSELKETKEESTSYKEGEGGGLVDIDWDKFPTGTKFTGSIESEYVSGRIYKLDGHIYLCQNEKNGRTPSDEITLEYENSWTICNGSNYELMENRVKIFSLELDPEYVPYVPRVVEINEAYEARVYPGYIVVGCQKISNSIVREIASKLMEEATNS